PATWPCARGAHCDRCGSQIDGPHDLIELGAARRIPSRPATSRRGISSWWSRRGPHGRRGFGSVCRPLGGVGVFLLRGVPESRPFFGGRGAWKPLRKEAAPVLQVAQFFGGHVH